MLKIIEIENLEQIYEYQMGFHSPYFFQQNFATWKESFADDVESEVKVVPHDMTRGNQQYIDFQFSGNQVGGCEVHFLDGRITYLRWIYVNENITGRGVGTKCMNALKQWLSQQGITRLDTDTAVLNLTAQRYYEKNGFTREGITRSYYLE